MKPRLRNRMVSQIWPEDYEFLTTDLNNQKDSEHLGCVALERKFGS